MNPRLVGALSASVWLAQAAWGFGLNKVQYERFDWSYFQTKHFDAYFSQGGDSIAAYAAKHLEGMYDDVSRTLGHELTDRVPVILHNTHAQFGQTNVLRFPLPEAVGGFTEAFKNRIVLPFEGSYSEFYHVLHHEMVHAFMYDLMFGRGAGGVMARQGGANMPLWVSEGLAEYISLGWDLSSEFFMMDATTSGYVGPPTREFGGFMAYKGGQLFFHFMENVFGEESIRKFIHELLSNKSVDKAFENVTRVSLEEAGELWLRELRYIYWPELGKRQHGKNFARQLTRHGDDLSYFNLQPAISPDNKEIAFFSDRQSREGIFILNLETEKVTRAVLQGGTKGRHQSFHSFKSGLAWGPGSKRLAIISESGGRDVIHIIDADKGDVLEEIAPPLEAMLSPCWSRDGRFMAFSGIVGGAMDIYLWDRDQKTLKQLTRDKAYDDKPAFSPSGDWIAFESERTALDGDTWGDFKDIYRIRIDGTELTRLTDHPYDDKMPAWGPADSLLAFVSNRSGLDNIYVLDDSAGSRRLYPVTNVLAGGFTPSWSNDGQLMAFSLFESGGWDIFLIKNPLEKKLEADLPESHFLRVAADSSLDFFRPVNMANLSSYKEDSTDTAAADTSAGTDSTGLVGAPADSLESGLTRSPRWESPGDSAVAMATDSAGGGADTSAPPSAEPSPDEPERLAGAEKDGKPSARGNRQKKWLDSADYLDQDGLFKMREYTPKFSMDAAAAALGVSNLDGSFGQGYIVLSDLMGDQEIQMVLSLDGDVKNSQVEVRYFYLPHRLDLGIGGFYRSYENRLRNSVVERSWGFSGSAVFPMSLYTRWEAEVFSQFISLEGGGDSGDVNFNTGRITPAVAWSHDNTQWGEVGPVNGRRVLATASITPPVIKDDLFFAIADLDMRQYWRWWKKYTLALRVNLGASEAVEGYRSPHRFWLGGDSFINIFPARTNGNNIPDEKNIEGWYYSEFAVPLRGYKYFEFSGNRKMLVNLEFRYPFVREFSVVWPIPMAIRRVSGVVFGDYGAAWTTGSEFEDSQGMAMGFGARLNLGIFVLRWTRAWPIDGVGNHQKSRTDYWSLGAEF